MTKAKTGDKVRVNYTGTLDDGSTFDSSPANAPLEFIIGKGVILNGLEKAVSGMTPGEKKTVHVLPEEGYGPRLDDRIVTIEKAQFPAELSLVLGQRFQHVRPNGRKDILTVVEINDTTVRLDANHPLAGKPLNFTVELLEIIA